MATHVSAFDGSIYHDLDTITDYLIPRGYTPNQANAAVVNHMYLDSYRHTDRRWKYNRYVNTTNTLLVEDAFINEVIAEVVESGIPTSYCQTGTPVKA